MGRPSQQPSLAARAGARAGVISDTRPLITAQNPSAGGSSRARPPRRGGGGGGGGGVRGAGGGLDRSAGITPGGGGSSEGSAKGWMMGWGLLAWGTATWYHVIAVLFLPMFVVYLATAAAFDGTEDSTARPSVIVIGIRFNVHGLYIDTMAACAVVAALLFPWISASRGRARPRVLLGSLLVGVAALVVAAVLLKAGSHLWPLSLVVVLVGELAYTAQVCLLHRCSWQLLSLSSLPSLVVFEVLPGPFFFFFF